MYNGKERVLKAFAHEKAAKIINKAKRPFFLVGGGAVISEASEEVTAFAHKLNAPVADSLMGKGAFPGTDDLYTGMIGMHGTKVANFGIHQADVVVVIGARFSDRVVGNAKKFVPKAKIVQIDIDRINEILKQRIIPAIGFLNDSVSELNGNKYTITVSAAGAAVMKSMGAEKELASIINELYGINVTASVLAREEVNAISIEEMQRKEDEKHYKNYKVITQKAQIGHIINKYVIQSFGH